MNHKNEIGIHIETWNNLYSILKQSIQKFVIIFVKVILNKPLLRCYQQLNYMTHLKINTKRYGNIKNPFHHLYIKNLENYKPDYKFSIPYRKLCVRNLCNTTIMYYDTDSPIWSSLLEFMIFHGIHGRV